MTEAKHTPGPWHLPLPDKAIVWREPYMRGEMRVHQPIADCSAPVGLSPEERTANARLIAAAPDLLEALQGLLFFDDRQTDEFIKARAAIAKATGAA